MHGHHDHARHPEEDNVKTSHQHIGWVEGIEEIISASLALSPVQPNVENVHSAEENHVSNTSSSWFNATSAGMLFWHVLLLRHDQRRHYLQHRTKLEYGDPTKADVKYTSLECCSSMPCTGCCTAQVQI